MYLFILTLFTSIVPAVRINLCITLHAFNTHSKKIQITLTFANTSAISLRIRNHHLKSKNDINQHVSLMRTKHITNKNHLYISDNIFIADSRPIRITRTIIYRHWSLCVDESIMVSLIFVVCSLNLWRQNEEGQLITW